MSEDSRADKNPVLKTSSVEGHAPPGEEVKAPEAVQETAGGVAQRLREHLRRLGVPQGFKELAGERAEIQRAPALVAQSRLQGQQALETQPPIDGRQASPCGQRGGESLRVHEAASARSM